LKLAQYARWGQGLGTMMNVQFIAALALLLNSNQAFAEVVSLVCEGTFYNYEANTVKSKVGAAAATLDIENKRFQTPVGTFHITSVEETSVSFDEPRSALVVFGTLDRITGTMTASWTTLAEDAKRQSLLPHKVQAYVDLTCSTAKRLF
jgi:hypothetical protein